MVEHPTGLALGLNNDGSPVVMLGATQQVTSAPDLLDLTPEPACPADLARAVNHLAGGGAYDVIIDPDQFANDYRARLGQEDPNADWQEGVIRLRDFGIPDFAQIEPPHRDTKALVYFVVDRFLGVPSRAVLAAGEVKPAYATLPLTPCPRPPRAAGGEADELPPIDPDLLSFGTPAPAA